MNYVDQLFADERIELHGKTFRNCTFNRCELVYDGDRSPTFSNNVFVDTVFVFSGAALRTIYFLGNLYHAGDGGREVINKAFDDIKNGAVHGHEVRTIAPHTVNHSLNG